MGEGDRFSSTISDEEIARQKIAKAKKRFVILFVLLVITAGARLIVKNPPKPKLADHSKESFRALPGVLENLPVAEQMKLSPQKIAAYREADLREIAKRMPKTEMAPYIPAEAPMENIQDKVEYERLLAKFEEKRRKMEDEHKTLSRDLSKDTLVMFKAGGYIKAEGAAKNENSVEIEYNKNFHAKLPGTLVKTIKENAVDWEEPVPNGFVKLHPAKGITVVVAKNISPRITVLKLKKDNET